MDSTDRPTDVSTALLTAAAQGNLPDWARVSPPRLEHMHRVADLMGRWADQLSISPAEKIRWRAVGYLHDALRDASPVELREQVPEQLRDLPGPLLHGPAAAHRLEGELDGPILDAIRYHTIGHPALDTMGRALYLADFLEPGRDFEIEWRARLSERMPVEMDEVLTAVVEARIRHLLEIRKPIRPETAAFWSDVVSRAP